MNVVYCINHNQVYEKDKLKGHLYCKYCSDLDPEKGIELCWNFNFMYFKPFFFDFLINPTNSSLKDLFNSSKSTILKEF